MTPYNFWGIGSDGWICKRFCHQTFFFLILPILFEISIVDLMLDHIGLFFVLLFVLLFFTAKNTVISPDFTWFCPKLWGNCAFTQNFHTRESSEITVFSSIFLVVSSSFMITNPDLLSNRYILILLFCFISAIALLSAILKLLLCFLLMSFDIILLTSWSSDSAMLIQRDNSLAEFTLFPLK